MQLFLKLLSGNANSVDPDQTAPSGAVWSGSALFAYAILLATLVYEILGHLSYYELLSSIFELILFSNDPLNCSACIHIDV